MANLPPRATAAIWTGAEVPRAWYQYLSTLGTSVADVEAHLATLAAVQTGQFLPNTTQVQGVLSVVSTGTLAGGVVQLALANDDPAPGNTYFYGTNAVGEKGWQALSDALVEGPGIDIAPDVDTGVLTLSHADTSSLSSFATVNTDGVVVQNIALTYDTFGHSTSAFIETIDLDARYAAAGFGTFNRIDTNGDIRVDADGNLRITN